MSNELDNFVKSLNQNPVPQKQEGIGAMVEQLNKERKEYNQSQQGGVKNTLVNGATATAQAVSGNSFLQKVGKGIGGVWDSLVGIGKKVGSASEEAGNIGKYLVQNTWANVTGDTGFQERYWNERREKQFDKVDREYMIENKGAERETKKVTDQFKKDLAPFLDTDSPYKRNIIQNDIDEFEKKNTDELQKIYGIVDKAERENKLNEYKTKVIPYQQDILKKKFSILDKNGSVYAYNQALEDPEIMEKVNYINDFTNARQAESFMLHARDRFMNADVLGSFFGGLQYATALGTVAVNKLSGLTDTTAIHNITSDYKYTAGGVAERAGTMGKNWYDARSAGSELYNSLDELGPMLLTSLVPGGGSSTLIQKIPFLSNSPKIANFVGNMTTDAFFYDQIAQSAMGRPMTEKEAAENFLINLPINGAIAAMARTPMTSRQLRSLFQSDKIVQEGKLLMTNQELDDLANMKYLTDDERKALASDATPDAKKEELIQKNQDGVELSILNRAKNGSRNTDTAILPNVTDPTQLKRIEDLESKINTTLKNFDEGTDTLEDYLKLDEANKQKYITPETASDFVVYRNASTAMAKNIETKAGTDAGNKYLANQLRNALTSGYDLKATIESLTLGGKYAPEATSIVNKILGIDPTPVTKTGRDTIKNSGIIRGQVGELLEKAYQTYLKSGQVPSGTQISPNHLYQGGDNVLNLKTGQTSSINDFVKNDLDNQLISQRNIGEVTNALNEYPDIAELFIKRLNRLNPKGTLSDIIKKGFKGILSEADVTVIRATLTPAIIADLKRRGKNVTTNTVTNHPAYKFFKEELPGTYTLNIQNLDAKNIAEKFKKQLAGNPEYTVEQMTNWRNQDEILGSLLQEGPDATIEAITKNQPDNLKSAWKGLVDMFKNKKGTDVPTIPTGRKITPKQFKEFALQIQKAFPSIQIEYTKLPDNVKGATMLMEGKVLIDPSKATVGTVVHEMAHVWTVWAKTENNGIYNALRTQIQDTKYYTDVVADYKGIYKSEDDIIDEAIVHAIQDKGAKLMTENEKRTFIQTVRELIQSFVHAITGKYPMDTNIRKAFEDLTGGNIVGEKTLQEYDILRFGKTDEEKFSYILARVVKRISDDDKFIEFIKQNHGDYSHDETVKMIIDALIKNEIPSEYLKNVPFGYLHAMEVYRQVIKNNPSMQAYTTTKVLKTTVSADSLFEMFKKSDIKNSKAKEFSQMPIEYIRFADRALDTMKNVLKVPCVFSNGSIASFAKSLESHVKAIKESDMTQIEKLEALRTISQEYGFDYLSKIQDALKTNSAPEFVYKMPDGKSKLRLDPNDIYKFLQAITDPKYLDSKDTLLDFVKKEDLKKNYKDWINIAEASKYTISGNTISITKGKNLNLDQYFAYKNRSRLIQPTPFEGLPLIEKGKIIVVTNTIKNDSSSYMGISDIDGITFITPDKYTDTLKGDNTILISSSVMDSSSFSQGLMDLQKDMMNETNKNVIKVPFDIVQQGNKLSLSSNEYVEFMKLTKSLDTEIRADGFDFSERALTDTLGRLSHNKISETTEKEILDIMHGTEKNSDLNKETLEGLGINPNTVPTVSRDQAIASLGMFGKGGDILRRAINAVVKLSGDESQTITHPDLLIGDNFLENYASSLQSNIDLNTYTVRDRSVTDDLNEYADEYGTGEENVNQMISDIQDLDIRNLDEADPLILEIPEEAFTDIEVFNNWKQEKIKDLQSKLPSDEKIALEIPTTAKAVNELIARLKEDGIPDSEISEVMKAIVNGNPAMTKDILQSNAIDYLPSVMDYHAARTANAILEGLQIEFTEEATEMFKKMMSKAFDEYNESNIKLSEATNETLLLKFLESAQESGVINEGFDLRLVMKNLTEDTKKSIYKGMQNAYRGNLTKILSEDSEKFTDTILNSIRKDFDLDYAPQLGKGDKDAMKDKFDIGEEQTEGYNIMSMTNVGTIYASFMRKVEDLHTKEKEALNPMNYSFYQYPDKPRYDNEYNITQWLNQPGNTYISLPKANGADNHYLNLSKPKTQTEKTAINQALGRSQRPDVGEKSAKEILKSDNQRHLQGRVAQIANDYNIQALNAQRSYDLISFIDAQDIPYQDYLEAINKAEYRIRVDGSNLPADPEVVTTGVLKAILATQERNLGKKADQSVKAKKHVKSEVYNKDKKELSATEKKEIERVNKLHEDKNKEKIKEYSSTKKQVFTFDDIPTSGELKLGKNEQVIHFDDSVELYTNKYVPYHGGDVISIPGENVRYIVGDKKQLPNGTVKTNLIPLDDNFMKSKNFYSEFVNVTGGTNGADTSGSLASIQNGFVNNDIIRPSDYKDAPKEVKAQIDKDYVQATENLGRKIPEKESDQLLQKRNWLQVHRSDEVFAFAEIEVVKGKYVVRGGTGYAVEYARIQGKPVYVYNTSHTTLPKGWYDMSNPNNPVRLEGKAEPILSKKYALIGSREIDQEAKDAINNLITKTKNTFDNDHIPTGAEAVSIKRLMETTAEEFKEIDDTVKKKMVDEYNNYRKEALETIENDIRKLSDEQIMEDYRKYYNIPEGTKIGKSIDTLREERIENTVNKAKRSFEKNKNSSMQEIANRFNNLNTHYWDEIQSERFGLTWLQIQQHNFNININKFLDEVQAEQAGIKIDKDYEEFLVDQKTKLPTTKDNVIYEMAAPDGSTFSYTALNFHQSPIAREMKRKILATLSPDSSSYDFYKNTPDMETILLKYKEVLDDEEYTLLYKEGGEVNQRSIIEKEVNEIEMSIQRLKIKKGQASTKINTYKKEPTPAEKKAYKKIYDKLTNEIDSHIEEYENLESSFKKLQEIDEKNGTRETGEQVKQMKKELAKKKNQIQEINRKRDVYAEHPVKKNHDYTKDLQSSVAKIQRQIDTLTEALERKKAELNTIAKEEVPVKPNNYKSVSYDDLSQATESGQVKLRYYGELKGQPPYIDGGINSLHTGAPDHFGNPFSANPKVIENAKKYNKLKGTVEEAERVGGIVQVSSDKEAVEKFLDFVQNSQTERAKMIREAIESGKYKGKPIYYYGDTGEASHANALDALINGKLEIDTDLFAKSARREEMKTLGKIQNNIMEGLGMDRPGTLPLKKQQYSNEYNYRTGSVQVDEIASYLQQFVEESTGVTSMRVVDFEVTGYKGEFRKEGYDIPVIDDVNEKNPGLTDNFELKHGPDRFNPELPITEDELDMERLKEFTENQNVLSGIDDDYKGFGYEAVGKGMDDIIVVNTAYLTPNYRKSKNQYEKVYSNYSFKVVLEDADGTYHMFDTLSKQFDEVEQIPTTESLLPDGLKKDEATQAKKKTDKIIQEYLCTL